MKTIEKTITGKIRSDKTHNEIMYVKGWFGIFWYKGYIVGSIQEYFKMKLNVTYDIKITEGGEFSFSDGHTFYTLLAPDKSYLGIVCKEKFDKLFFKPDPDKTYDITVTEISKE